VDFVNLLVIAPTGFWQTLIEFFNTFILDYAWAIIVLTICIKLILSPLDFFNKKVSRDNIKMQSELAPQLQKLQKQYANDKMKLNQKTQELYRSSGYNLTGSCITMLINFALTLIIFITLFTALHAGSSYKIEQQYLLLKQEYETVYVESIGNGEDEAVATQTAQEAVLVLYDNTKNDFLWVQNIWVADNFWTSAILPFDSYIASVGNNVKMDIDGENFKYNELPEEDKLAFEEDYNKVMQVLIDNRGGVNGYLITAIVAILTCFSAQYLMQKRTLMKNSNNPQQATTQQTNKVLLIVLPVIMGVFTLFYNAIFGLYIISSQIVSLVTFPIIDKFLDKYYAKKDKKKQQNLKMDYSRK
jgi:YidC/Oxa1 family membrane protein insertase